MPSDSILGEEPLVDLALQNWTGPATMPTPNTSWDGVGNVNGVLPPDSNGDVGPNRYVQWVNLSFAIWDKSGTRLYGPAAGSTLWSGFGGPCQTQNDGDPIALYDQMADRWLMSQFALPNGGPFYQCIAVSQSPDPTGSYYRYAFEVSATKINDYAKLGVWPDAYYMAVNQFDSVSLGYAGVGAFAFDRAKMLAGDPATFISFDLSGVNPNFFGMLPSHLVGSVLPPAGAPNYFAEVDDSAAVGPSDAMRLWEFHVNWTTPASSTFGISGQPNTTLTVTPFNLLPCVMVSSRDCIPQPGTSQRLDSLGDRLMYRLNYRNFGDHESLVVNHTVLADGSDRAGVRWYEARKSGGSWSIYQQGTFAPTDGSYRWTGSTAMDHDGNMALGYSVSSSTMYPSIRYVGRLAGDPLGTMPQGETTLTSGGGSQTSAFARWGDYSSMGVDPNDDCTFWYTQEYLKSTSSASWSTRIGSFRFPTCGVPAADFTALPVIGASPLTVNFTDLSTGVISTHSWSFGDGEGSSLQNPTHTYTATGSFTVTLTVSGTGGSSTQTNPAFITVYPYKLILPIVTRNFNAG